MQRGSEDDTPPLSAERIERIYRALNWQDAQSQIDEAVLLGADEALDREISAPDIIVMFVRALATALNDKYGRLGHALRAAHDQDPAGL
jgi:hypothetical protein